MSPPSRSATAADMAQDRARDSPNEILDNQNEHANDTKAQTAAPDNGPDDPMEYIGWGEDIFLGNVKSYFLKLKEHFLASCQRIAELEEETAEKAEVIAKLQDAGVEKDNVIAAHQRNNSGLTGTLTDLREERAALKAEIRKLKEETKARDAVDSVMTADAGCQTHNLPQPRSGDTADAGCQTSPNARGSRPSTRNMPQFNWDERMAQAGEESDSSEQTSKDSQESPASSRTGPETRQSTPQKRSLEDDAADRVSTAYFSRLRSRKAGSRFDDDTTVSPSKRPRRTVDVLEIPDSQKDGGDDEDNQSGTTAAYARALASSTPALKGTPKGAQSTDTPQPPQTPEPEAGAPSDAGSNTYLDRFRYDDGSRKPPAELPRVSQLPATVRFMAQTYVLGVPKRVTVPGTRKNFKATCLQLRRMQTQGSSREVEKRGVACDICQHKGKPCFQRVYKSNVWVMSPLPAEKRKGREVGDVGYWVLSAEERNELVRKSVE